VILLILIGHHHSQPGSLGWVWEPSVLIGLLAIGLGYALVTGPLRSQFKRSSPVSVNHQAAFYAGCLSMFIALVSPLDSLADETLFSAHMAQHMLLMFITPPLWLIGLPDWLAEALIPQGKLRHLFARLVHPFSAFVIFNATMWIWHIPRFYDAALSSEPLHIAEHLAFLAAALFGWWPVLGPSLDGVSLPVLPLRTLYLFGNSLSCTALAALITFSPAVVYTFYGASPFNYGLTPLADQQLGGLLMWLPGDMILMLAIVFTLVRWFGLDNSPSKQVSGL